MTAREIADEYPRPPVTSACFVCGVTSDDIERGVVIVSPTGKAHHADEDHTACGHDATGEQWWWPL